MPTVPRIINPIESIKQTAADVAGDVAESMGLPRSTEEPQIEQGQKTVPAAKQKQIKNRDNSKLAQTRQNLARINQEIVEARRKRLQTETQTEQVQQQAVQVKENEKMKKESVLSKLLKSRKGTKEAMQRSGG
ncbi:MAG: hypothetical protein Q7S31_02685 [bacterium]|nr:hypothetical protein [bacterium]